MTTYPMIPCTTLPQYTQTAFTKVDAGESIEMSNV